ncbi:MAG: hypothetical protein V1744_04025 [Candidatus Altiarchaeota archaeon]
MDLLDYVPKDEEVIGKHSIGGYDIATTGKHIICFRRFPQSFSEIDYRDVNNIEHVTSIAWGELTRAIVSLTVSTVIIYSDWGLALVDPIEGILRKYLPELSGTLPTELLLKVVMVLSAAYGLYCLSKFVPSMRGYFRISRRGGASVIIPTGMTPELQSLIREIGERIGDKSAPSAVAGERRIIHEEPKRQMEDIKTKLNVMLKEMGANTVVLVSAKSENHTAVVTNMMDILVNQRGMGGVYLNITKPYEFIRTAMKEANVPQKDVYFIDCISLTAGKAPQGGDDNVVFVENPSSLEEVSMYLDRMLDRVRKEKKFLFLDSLSSLLIYNTEKSVKEFTHFLINNIRLKNIAGVVLSIEKKEVEELVKTLNPMCDIEIRF